MSTDLDATVDEYRSPVSDLDARSVVNAQTIVQGTIKSSTDLRVEGQVNGVIECDGVLYVADGAVIDATVEAGGIVVEGSLSGTILCHGRLEIRSSGSVTAEVDTERLVIHEGAIYEGRLRMDASDHASSTLQDEEREATPTALETPSSSYPYLRSFSPSPPGDDDDQIPTNADDADKRG